MKVKELIEELSKFDTEYEVFTSIEDNILGNKLVTIDRIAINEAAEEPRYGETIVVECVEDLTGFNDIRDVVVLR